MKILSKITCILVIFSSLVACGVYTDGYGYNDQYNAPQPYYDGGYYVNNTYYSGPNYNYYAPGGYWGDDGYYYRRGVVYYYDNNRPYFYNYNRNRVYVEKRITSGRNMNNGFRNSNHSESWSQRENRSWNNQQNTRWTEQNRASSTQNNNSFSRPYPGNNSTQQITTPKSDTGNGFRSGGRR
ncbi:translation initiation factor IF-2 [Elizabethkingia argenteiflava]|uniref:translation initiation factor IF-2 n=1 Tax=Elizabethkingia argenteiflava TaxID=2681556 RepID=UPI001FCE49E2|nr:translation initiation factor IF-2 [Elizabethkingia argenteiflava]